MNISEHVYDVIVDVGQAPALWITTSMPTGVCADDILLFASAMFLAQSQSSITCFFILAIVPPSSDTVSITSRSRSIRSCNTQSIMDWLISLDVL